MNPEPSPIACSLAADALEARLDRIRAIGSRSLLQAEAGGAAQVLRFRRDAPTRRALEQIVAAERRCCAFLRLDLLEEDDELVLRIAAPEGGADVAAALAAAFASGQRPSPSSSTR